MFDQFRDRLDSPDGPTRYEAWGSLFQFPMVGVFVLMLMLYGRQAPPLLVAATLPGAALFHYCLYRLYFRRERLTGLVTTGPFRWTRHPMYLGLLGMSLFVMSPGPSGYTATQVLLYLLFLALMGSAALFQELETVERFGADAEAYYNRTPRIPLLF